MKVLIVAMAALATIAVEYRVFVATPGMDFDHYYAAAQMLRSGSGSRLYDVSFFQDQLQRKYGHQSGTPFFNYPAATATLYLPATFFSLYHGYLILRSDRSCAFQCLPRLRWAIRPSSQPNGTRL